MTSPHLKGKEGGSSRAESALASNSQPDLFAILRLPCGECANLGDAIDSGVRYCRAMMMWRWASERVDCRCFARAA